MMTRRFFKLSPWLLGFLALSVVAAGQRFDFDALQKRAQTLASKPYEKLKTDVPEWLRRLSYDQLRQIEFGGGQSLWFREQLPFQVQYVHPGYIYDKTVHLFELSGNRAKVIPFRREYFNYGSTKVQAIPSTMGFAGFRLMYPLSGPGKRHQEVGSFLGASYFRFLSPETAYGLSARGLAINTAEPEPEEFPLFTEFWLERPSEGARSMDVYALLDSESVTGAYKFTITPGTETVLQIKAVLYCRKNPKIFGVAPLTSMFWRGENSSGSNDDYRPEVHDSDGLLMHNGAGEWIWRPLDSPKHLRVSTFMDENPRAFGLLQRDRNFENYQDLEASYHARPSAWIEPVGQWGRGTVRLVELPTKDEFNDNIVAFWCPEKLPAVGEPIEVEYRLHWHREQALPPAGFVRATRHGKSAYYEPGLHRFIVEFDGRELQASAADTKMEHLISVGEGAKLNHSTLQKNALNGTWRVAFTIRPDASGRPVELRCFLRQGSDAVTETWSYLWQPSS